MALIQIHGPRYLYALAKFKTGMGFPAWDLAPDVPNVGKLDVPQALTESEAISYVDNCAWERKWLDHAGWTAEFNSPPGDGIEGREL